MKFALLFFLSLFSLILPLSAQEVTSETDTSMVFVSCECSPSYPGGHEAFFAYVDSVLVYPETLQELALNQDVLLEFAVNIDSTLSEITVLNPVLPPFEKEATRVLKNSGKWIPGTWCCGEKRALKMYYVLMIRFVAL